MNNAYKFFLEYFRDIAGLDHFAKPLSAIICIVIIIIVAWFSHFLTRHIILRIVSHIAKRTKTNWDDILVKNKVFNGLAHLVPAFIIYYSTNFSYPVIHQPISELDPATLAELSKDYYFTLAGLLLKFSKLYFTIIIVYVGSTILNSAMDIYNTTDYAHHRPVKGYVQLLKILIYFMAGIMIVSVLLERDPTVLLAGLGAMAAVLLLIFKDTIFGICGIYSALGKRNG